MHPADLWPDSWINITAIPGSLNLEVWPATQRTPSIIRAESYTEEQQPPNGHITYIANYTGVNRKLFRKLNPPFRKNQTTLQFPSAGGATGVSWVHSHPGLCYKLD
jgi:hypothetical protein